MVDKKKIAGKSKEVTTEFKKFAFKEATLGAAVGIMLGAAFRDVINSLVNDVLSPPIGYLTSGIDFTTLYFVLGGNGYESIEAAREAGAVVIHYGNFINEFITFLITAIILFLIAYQSTKIIAKISKKEEEKESKKKKTLCPFCKSEVDPKATRCPFCTSTL